MFLFLLVGNSINNYTDPLHSYEKQVVEAISYKIYIMQPTGCFAHKNLPYW